MNKNAILVLVSFLVAPAMLARADEKRVLISLPAPLMGLNPVALDNPDRKIIEAEIQDVISNYKQPAYDPPDVEEPLQLETSALERLFPKHRFYVIYWEIKAAKTPEGRMVSVTGLYFTLVIPPEGKPLKLYGYGNYEDFGRLLHINGVRLKSMGDAQLIWTAFKDVHRNQRWQGVNRSASPTEWILGENQIDNFNYWHRVTLDDNKVVTSTKFMAEEVKKTPKLK